MMDKIDVSWLPHPDIIRNVFSMGFFSQHWPVMEKWCYFFPADMLQAKIPNIFDILLVNILVLEHSLLRSAVTI